MSDLKVITSRITVMQDKVAVKMQFIPTTTTEPINLDGITIHRCAHSVDNRSACSSMAATPALLLHDRHDGGGNARTHMGLNVALMTIDHTSGAAPIRNRMMLVVA
jgi:hypothetical protein